MIRETLILGLLAATGCRHPAVPYRPDRTVARAIPPERAKEELRRVLAEHTWCHVNLAEAPQKIEFRDDGFAFSDPDGDRYSFAYAALEPHAYELGQQSYLIRLYPGEKGALDRMVAANGYLKVFGTENAEVLMDAIESLKASGARR